MAQTFKEGHVLLTAARLAGKLMAECYIKRHGHTDSLVALEYSHKFTCPLMPTICPDTEYDLAISFLTPHYIVAEKVCARRKIAWIHTDYTCVQVNQASEYAMWGRYDGIAAISEAAMDGFVRRFPMLEEKVFVMENILPAALIRQQAEAFDPSGEMSADGSIRLLSVGRYCNAKNFDNVPDICSRLRRAGLDVKWYIIGFGGDEALIRRRISEAGMQEHVILLGKRDNPYPYIAACDLYVQPSRYEGKCVTVREAQLLGKPVVITRYATSSSQLEDGVDGVIVPMDNEDCAAGIAALLRNPKRMQRLGESCCRRDYSNAEEVKNLYDMME
jgi:glycosyltransferase involved in cell wall biosynthesis